MKFSARFIVIFLLISFCLSLFATPASAQTNPYTAPNTNPDVPKNLHTWTQSVMLEVMSALTCQLTGINPASKDHKCLGIDQKTGNIGFVQNGGGAIGMMGGLIAQTYTPPLHTGDYFNYLAQNFGIAKKAYAQGAGFEGLSPLANIWTAFRNIVYLLFVIVFVVVGFAIMLRIHIDPRTVMTIENQIPKIIIGLILATLSFPIAGLLIDLMYVTIYVVINIMGQVDPALGTDVVTIAQSTHPLGAAGVIGPSGPLGTGGIFGLASSGASSASEFFKPLGEHPIGRIITAGGMAALGFIFGGALPDLVKSVLSLIPGAHAISFTIGAVTKLDSISSMLSGIFSGLFAIGGGLYAPDIAKFVGWGIVFLILTIALLWALFRLWFQLIIAYVYFLLDVVLAPFWIVGGLFPGSPIGFGPWIREILANLSAFPTVIGMFLLGRVFIDAFASASGKFFVPPLIGNPAYTNTNGALSAIGSLIGIGIILMTPQVVTMMRDLFKPPPFKYSAAIGQAIGVGGGAINLPGHAMKFGMFSYYWKSLRDGPLGSFLGPKGTTTERPRG